MCKCNNIKIVDVLYHVGDGNIMMPYHKDCGEDLSNEQKTLVDRIQREKWDKTG
jgi:hypothetical protein